MNCAGDRDDRKLVANGYDFRKCLCNFIHPNFGHYYNLNKAYNLGRSLYSDRYTEEPNQIIEIIDLLDELKIDLENETNKKLEKKQQDAAKKSKRK